MYQLMYLMDIYFNDFNTYLCFPNTLFISSLAPLVLMII